MEDVVAVGSNVENYVKNTVDIENIINVEYVEFFYNTVYKERSKRRKVAGAVSRNDSNEISAKLKPASNHTYYVYSLDGEYTVPKASYNDDDNDSDEEGQDGDTYDLEIGAHLQKPIFYKCRK